MDGEFIKLLLASLYPLWDTSVPSLFYIRE